MKNIITAFALVSLFAVSSFANAGEDKNAKKETSKAKKACCKGESKKSCSEMKDSGEKAS